ncbi:lea domain containing protein [Grosmannia clavigera kw1407]|uniref:Lea domain containing protein n=1 Tax=Grosmannia clavigera (strain kw1407 / UAMH 11150) TaxID=655863 RepID=F0XSF1_GROCL|nr:lea domain containing protein [Grosmannia clavigera kw1407]EFW99212.1 lea domain containing protein [Grosmannia clavigera kw1407]
MFASSKTPAWSLPEPQLSVVRPGISLLKPLSRRGEGPGLIVLCPDAADSLTITNGVPWPLIKWAEEGYAVAEIQARAVVDAAAAVTAVHDALRALSDCNKCAPKAKVGLVAYSALLWNSVAAAIPQFTEVAGAVIYAEASEQATVSVSATPRLLHLGGPSSAGRAMERSEGLTQYRYPNTKSYRFAIPFQDDFDYSAEAVAHTRSLTFLKPLVSGPFFDLETLWEEHTFYEFEDRSVEHTMSTMVQEPYVNHIPTITGGIGRADLTSFYGNHFIFTNPQNAAMELVSRTIGIDRVIDEFLYKFTHDSIIDWLLPGIPPTGKWVEVPFTAVVNIRGDRLYHEHIAWDQGTLLAQLGLLPEYLPFPYPVPGKAPSSKDEPERKYEYRLPVAGIETAAKLRDKNSGPSNKMFEFAVREC